MNALFALLAASQLSGSYQALDSCKDLSAWARGLMREEPEWTITINDADGNPHAIHHDDTSMDMPYYRLDDAGYFGFAHAGPRMYQLLAGAVIDIEADADHLAVTFNEGGRMVTLSYADHRTQYGFSTLKVFDRRAAVKFVSWSAWGYQLGKLDLALKDDVLELTGVNDTVVYYFDEPREGMVCQLRKL